VHQPEQKNTQIGHGYSPGGGVTPPGRL
jgi:hypothetical protein